MSVSNAPNIPIEYGTGTIHLRRYSPHDVSNLIDAVRESIASVGRWQDWCRADYGENEANAWLTHAADAWDSAHGYEFAIIDTSSARYLGGIGINQRNRQHNFANIGYWVRESAQRRGAASHALRLAIDFAFTKLQLGRVEIIAALENRASRGVAEAVGARLEGIARNRLVLGPHALDAAVYAMVPDDWNGV